MASARGNVPYSRGCTGRCPARPLGEIAAPSLATKTSGSARIARTSPSSIACPMQLVDGSSIKQPDARVERADAHRTSDRVDREAQPALVRGARDDYAVPSHAVNRRLEVVFTFFDRGP